MSAHGGSEQLIEWHGQLPDVSSETKPFWDACNRGVFLIQRCRDCHKTQYHYRAICCHCWSSAVEDLPAKGSGTIWTYSVVMKNRSPVVAFEPPYIVALVELDEGVRVFANIVNCDPNRMTIGMPVQLTFAEAESGQKIPLFRPAAA